MPPWAAWVCWRVRIRMGWHVQLLQLLQRRCGILGEVRHVLRQWDTRQCTTRITFELWQRMHAKVGFWGGTCSLCRIESRKRRMYRQLVWVDALRPGQDLLDGAQLELSVRPDLGLLRRLEEGVSAGGYQLTRWGIRAGLRSLTWQAIHRRLLTRGSCRSVADFASKATAATTPIRNCCLRFFRQCNYLHFLG